MKKIIPILLVGILVFGTAASASAKVVKKSSSTTRVMRYVVTDPDDPDPK